MKSDRAPPTSNGGTFSHFDDFGLGEDNASNIDKISQIRLYVINYCCSFGKNISLKTTYILGDGSTSTKTNGAHTSGSPTGIVDLQNEEYISSIEVLWETYVSHMKICTTSGQCYGPFGHSFEVPANVNFDAPSGGIIKALHGKSGSWVDAIGVHYEVFDPDCLTS